MKRALVLNAINPRIGGVLVRGEKGTAKSTAVRALASLLPEISVMPDCPYACDPATPDTWCDYCVSTLDTTSSPPSPMGGDAEYYKRRRGQGGVRSVPRRVPIVELPVGATEDRVIGTLDLERAIKEGERHFEPGLLAAANRGILYIDEVNLLADHLVDVLLDAAAMGTNYVEREGVSVRHPAQFLLVGTMNPEEGDLRPQLLDRFALAVEVENLRSPADRAEVVRRRIAFEADPRAFAAAWADAESAERDRILSAQGLLPRVRLDDQMLGLITQLCCDFEVDGLRADIVMYKAALTLAAYAGRLHVNETDVRDAAELALLHRRRRQPFQQPDLDRERLDERIQDYLDQHPHDDPADPEDADGPASADAATRPSPPGRRATRDTTSVAGSEVCPQDTTAPDQDTPPAEAELSTPGRVFAPGQPPPPPSLAAPAPPRLRDAARGRRSKALVFPWQTGASRSGPYVRSVTPREHAWREVALDATVRAAAAHQRARRAAADPPPALPVDDPVAPRSGGARRSSATGASGSNNPALRLERADLRQKVRASRLSNLILFVVDASGSMAARDRMVAAKGAVLSLLLDAYRKRDQVGLVAFRGRAADLLLPPTNSVDLAEACLRDLPTGGRTPLAHGLDLARQTLERHTLNRPGVLPLLVLISDGRANVPLAPGASSSPPVPYGEGRDSAGLSMARSRGGKGLLLSEIQAIGVQLQRREIASVVIDTESGPLLLGLARQVAEALSARYLSLGELDASSIASAVREARA
jgi:magnesium chelatase subunit D